MLKYLLEKENIMYDFKVNDSIFVLDEEKRIRIYRFLYPKKAFALSDKIEYVDINNTFYPSLNDENEFRKIRKCFANKLADFEVLTDSPDFKKQVIAEEIAKILSSKTQLER